MPSEMSEVIKLIAPILVIQLILVITCIRSIIKEEVNYLPKWAWVLVVCFITLFGAITYLAIGRKRY